MSVSVTAGGKRAPEAVVLEHGGVEGTFRHPVFGNRDVWVSQKARPFLAPAFKEGEELAVAAADRALQKILRALAD